MKESQLNLHYKINERHQPGLRRNLIQNRKNKDRGKSKKTCKRETKHCKKKNPVKVNKKE